MSKRAVQIDLVHLAEKRNNEIVAILQDGRLHSSEMKTFIEEDKALVAVVTERLAAPQRVKVNLDDLDCSASVSENA